MLISDEKQKRLDRYFMDVAIRTSEMSYAQRAKVGCILTYNNRIIATGWNGQPSGIDNCCEYRDSNNNLITLPTVIHAEANLISFCAKYGIKMNGSTLYLSLSPCITCALLILQTGISRVVYNDEYRNKEGINFLNEHGIICEKIED